MKNIFYEYCLKELMLKNTNIKIEIDDISSNLKGFVYKDSDQYVIVVKNSMSEGQIFLTILHELIHVQQYVYKNLEKALAENFYDQDYENSWWEIEAREKTKTITERFIGNEIGNK